MLIFDDCTSAEVEAIVRRVLLGFRQKPPFQLLAFTSGENYNQTRRLIQTGNWMHLSSNSNFSRVLQQLPITRDLSPSKESNRSCVLVDVNQMSVGVGGKIVQTPTSASHLNPSGLHI